MQLHTLGTLRLEGAAFSQPKPLVLLSYLSLEGAKPRRHLAELFWPEGQRMKSLSMTLTRLRQGAGEVVEKDAGKAWTTVRSDARALLEALNKSHWQRAADSYNGAFLEGVQLEDWSAELEEWVYATREHLAERVQHALLSLAEAAARERAFGHAAALAERAYRLPGLGGSEVSALKRLYSLLSAGQSLLAPEVRKELEAYGYKVALTTAAAQASFDTARLTHNQDVPQRSTSFVGRERELADAAALLARPDCRLLTLLGAGGVGKTRLALQLAQQRLKPEAYPDGSYLVLLEAVPRLEQLPLELLRSLGLEPKPGEPWAQVMGAVEDRRMLWVLDNFEHLAGAAPALAEWLRRCPNLKLLVTSRERLGLEEEFLFALEGLGYPQASVPWPEAQSYDAVRLFVARARQLQPEFSADSQLPHLLEICRRLEGLPLGLELAASWVRHLHCAEIAAELERGAALHSSLRHVPERHRSLRAVFEASWSLLDAREQAALRRLAVFQGGFRREAASEVADATLPLLAALVDKSLLRSLANGRYDRHPLLYQYMREKLAADPQEQRRAEDAHRQHFLQLLQQQKALREQGKEQDVILTLREEWENLHVTLSRSLQDENLAALEAFVGLSPLTFELRGAFLEGLEFLSRVEALLAAKGTGGSLLGRVRIEKAWYHQRLGDFAAARAAAELGLASLPETGAESLSAKGLTTLALLSRVGGRHHEAARTFEQALSLARRGGDDEVLASVLGSLGILEGEVGRQEVAAEYFREAVALHQRAGRVLSAIRELGNLAITYGIMGELQRSGELMEESLRLARALDFKQTLPYTLSNLGVHYARLGQPERALELNREALAVAEETGQREIQIGILNNLVGVLAEVGEVEQALSCSARALALAQELAVPGKLLQSLVARAELELRRQRYEVAARLALLVQEHPASVSYSREQARALLGKLSGLLEPEKLEAARAFARDAGALVAGASQESGLWRELLSDPLEMGGADAPVPRS